eukprot:scaffold9904_cov100-Isochrysis_galbana.AAC.4
MPLPQVGVRLDGRPQRNLGQTERSRARRWDIGQGKRRRAGHTRPRRGCSESVHMPRVGAARPTSVLGNRRLPTSRRADDSVERERRGGFRCQQSTRPRPVGKPALVDGCVGKTVSVCDIGVIIHPTGGVYAAHPIGQ